MSIRRVAVLVGLMLMVAGAARLRTGQADEWLPISPEELKMTSDPAAPGAPAIILYRQVDRDDSNAQVPHEYNYVREKIFTEEGRKYGDVEIPFVKGDYEIVNIRARTVHPDGTAVLFDGKIYEKEIVKARGFKYLAKTFTMSDVQPGSILEYHYMIDFKENYVFNSNWVLSSDLFTKSAKFTLKPYMEWPLQWSWPNGLPNGVKPPEELHDHNHNIQMTAENIPAFVEEDNMPPEAAMKFRVDFIYKEDGLETDPDRFWKKQGKKSNDYVDGFVNKKKALEQAVSETVSPGDSPEVKLEKLYVRVEKIRNTSYELEKTAEEEKRDKEKYASNVEDVLKRGYGTGDQITLLYWGLARAAGLDASAVKISLRDDRFFIKSLMRADDLRTYVVLVKVNGKDMYFDPGTKYTPFGMLPWSETGTTGLKLDKDGGTWVVTSIPQSKDSEIERKADLNLTTDGSLEGKLKVTYTGLEALYWRLEERNEDDTDKKKSLEDDVKSMIPVAAEVELTNKPDWANWDGKLEADFTLKVQGWVSGAGHRALMPVGLFTAGEKHMFEHETRVHPVYFHFGSEKTDDVTIELPLGWQVSSVPKPTTDDAKLLLYSMTVENNKGTLHEARVMRSDLISLDPKYYPALRRFYQVVRTADEEQIVLEPGRTAASN
ncbi:MAG TPA: DUF3857 domain-containing protein [Candidatus Acidoferrum sp.]|nr:DUF3857 domain-containing protein [Candidatus Acidoferrum sp.]